MCGINIPLTGVQSQQFMCISVSSVLNSPLTTYGHSCYSGNPRYHGDSNVKVTRGDRDAERMWQVTHASVWCELQRLQSDVFFCESHLHQLQLDGTARSRAKFALSFNGIWILLYSFVPRIKCTSDRNQSHVSNTLLPMLQHRPRGWKVNGDPFELPQIDLLQMSVFLTFQWLISTEVYWVYY